MKTNNKLNKANAYRLSQEILRNKALQKVLILLLLKQFFYLKILFWKKCNYEPYVVIGPKVKIGDNSYIKSFTHIEGTKIEKNVVLVLMQD